MGRPLGAGCTGEVKLAFHKDTGKEVAIKMIRFVALDVLDVGLKCWIGGLV